MKKQITLLIAVCGICFLFYRCSNSATANQPSGNDSSSLASNGYGGYASQAEWGKHLVTICDCNNCHTPKKMTDQGPVEDTSLMLAGHLSQMPVAALKPEQLAQGMAATLDLTAWNGPWGISYAANLTPDSTGLGAWSEEQFMTCLRQGLYKGLQGSRPIMQPMPIAAFKNMTDDELKAIFAYLKTIKPIHNVVAEYQPPASAHK